MILYYFPIAQNKTVSDFFFFRDVNACLCMCTYFTIFLFTGLIPVYLQAIDPFYRTITFKKYLTCFGCVKETSK